ncbi:hotdog fold domain-containing protein [Rhodococcus phenolicus]|uniref:hotdog fold domain-containing protein n=1 Tax=Rhodococcus phenolicus TaxID=263849 RepID=UPI000829CEFD|nr:hotdog fold domain-containing protein [Rhodococcus phenolicus]
MTTTPTYRAWTRLSGGPFGSTPLGSALFSLGMCARVPYFATVLPRVTLLEPGRCEVRAPKWWGVHNHLGTFHAIAACNLAEAAMGMLAEATVPTTHRWIPKAMTTRYLTKATTGLHAVAQLTDLPDFETITGDTGGAELTIPVSIGDKNGTEVVHADITVWITRR